MLGSVCNELQLAILAHVHPIDHRDEHTKASGNDSGDYPIAPCLKRVVSEPVLGRNENPEDIYAGQDRKSTRLNSSHSQISYAVFCLKKKQKLQREYI